MVNGPSVLVEPPESYTEGPFIIFNSVRKSNFCTEILIKLRPLAIARTSLICALFNSLLEVWHQECNNISIV